MQNVKNGKQDVMMGESFWAIFIERDFASKGRTPVGYPSMHFDQCLDAKDLQTVSTRSTLQSVPFADVLGVRSGLGRRS